MAHPDDLGDLIRVSDFTSTKIEAKLQNNTTGMPIRSEPPTRVLEIQDRGIVFEIPSKSCARGHSLTIEIKATTPDETQYRFTSTARVEELESLKDGTDRVNVVFLQFDEKIWDEFCKSFNSRQDEIERFFRAARGY